MPPQQLRHNHAELLNSPLNEILTEQRQNGTLSEERLCRIISTQITEGHAPSAAIVTLAYLSQYPESFREYYRHVIQSPRDWVLFIDLCRKGSIRNGLGRCIKTEIRKSLQHYGQFETKWYPEEVRQLIAVSHPTPNETHHLRS